MGRHGHVHEPHRLRIMHMQSPRMPPVSWAKQLAGSSRGLAAGSWRRGALRKAQSIGKHRKPASWPAPLTAVQHGCGGFPVGGVRPWVGPGHKEVQRCGVGVLRGVHVVEALQLHMQQQQRGCTVSAKGVLRSILHTARHESYMSHAAAAVLLTAPPLHPHPNAGPHPHPPEPTRRRQSFLATVCRFP